MSYLVLKDDKLLIRAGKLLIADNSPPESTCCCNCSAAGASNPQVSCHITNSTCESECEAGTMDQEVPWDLLFSGSYEWDVQPQSYQLATGSPPPAMNDDCLICKVINDFGFDKYYTTGLRIALRCLTTGPNAGKWQVTVARYRRDDDHNPCTDYVGNMSTSTVVVLVPGGDISVVAGDLVGTVHVVWPDLTASSGFFATGCEFDIVFGP